MPETCKTCRFWQKVGIGKTFGYAETLHDCEVGICRANPPKIIDGLRNGTQGVFPLTIAELWCGEHQSIPIAPKNVTSTNNDIRFA